MGLPDELLLRLFGFLDVPALCRASQACRHWARVAGDRNLWTGLARRLGYLYSCEELPADCRALCRYRWTQIGWRAGRPEKQIYSSTVPFDKLVQFGREQVAARLVSGQVVVFDTGASVAVEVHAGPAVDIAGSCRSWAAGIGQAVLWSGVDDACSVVKAPGQVTAVGLEWEDRYVAVVCGEVQLLLYEYGKKEPKWSVAVTFAMTDLVVKDGVVQARVKRDPFSWAQFSVKNGRHLGTRQNLRTPLVSLGRSAFLLRDARGRVDYWYNGMLHRKLICEGGAGPQGLAVGYTREGLPRLVFVDNKGQFNIWSFTERGSTWQRILHPYSKKQ